MAHFRFRLFNLNRSHLFHWFWDLLRLNNDFNWRNYLFWLRLRLNSSLNNFFFNSFFLRNDYSRQRYPNRLSKSRLVDWFRWFLLLHCLFLLLNWLFLLLNWLFLLLHWLFLLLYWLFLLLNWLFLLFNWLFFLFFFDKLPYWLNNEFFWFPFFNLDRVLYDYFFFGKNQRLLNYSLLFLLSCALRNRLTLFYSRNNLSNRALFGFLMLSHLFLNLFLYRFNLHDCLRLFHFFNRLNRLSFFFQNLLYKLRLSYLLFNRLAHYYLFSLLRLGEVAHSWQSEANRL